MSKIRPMLQSRNAQSESETSQQRILQGEIFPRAKHLSSKHLHADSEDVPGSIFRLLPFADISR